ncbi:GNAT family N-acetyltransferase [Paenibacillus sp. MWE-103]|uniref:GNAT family N-acetyltransferase n=1 Tax=Paenibacillus artemisiicola TaxID=1172618 RepID=A0ABS3WJY3_9BACL|nr:GNAT family N-acetyltransferase [Paenibacillus artemisiicola]MBO7748435.1 GNAT family N-acetyltransferase [Paenibacillus artemisiicola]
MTTGIRVNQAAIGELDELAAVFDQYRVFYGQPSDVSAARAFLFERFEYRDSIVFAARDVRTDALVGFAQLYPAFSSISMARSLILNDLFVVPDARKRGIGQLLLDAALRYAKQTNAKGLELSTAAGNVAARRLYERNGYERDESFYHYFLSARP